MVSVFGCSHLFMLVSSVNVCSAVLCASCSWVSMFFIRGGFGCGCGSSVMALVAGVVVLGCRFAMASASMSISCSCVFRYLSCPWTSGRV